MKKHDMLMVGVGGQGIILASDVIGNVALASGYDVKKTDTLGMAQRGGSVVSHVRIASKVFSPLIREGEADILVAFEKLEVARWAHYLRPGGLAIVNDQAIPTLSISLGRERYPSDQEVRDILKRHTDRIIFVPGIEQALKLGNARALNTVMLGYLSSFLPFKVRVWKECIREYLPSTVLPLNLAAFDKGRREAQDMQVQ